MPSNSFPTSTFPNTDCDRPACDDIQDALRIAREKMTMTGDKSKKSSGSATAGTSTSSMTATDESKSSSSSSKAGSTSQQVAAASYSTPSTASSSSSSCPPRSAELGRSSWTLLHSMAAWYPDNPTRQEQTRMANFMEALGDFYPCPWCADDFRAELQKTPPAVETRTDLCMWLCDQHNRVNQKLGKQLFDCNMRDLDERWRKSTDPNCTRR